MSSWLRSFPILRLQSRSLCSVSGHPRTLKLRSWMVHAFTVSVWPWQRSNRASPSSRGWEGLLLSLPLLASLPQAENRRLVLWAIWGLQWEPFRLASPGHLTPLAAAVLCGSLVILLLRLTTCPAFHSARPIEDQILIAASVVWLLSSEDEDLAGLPLWCCRHRKIGLLEPLWASAGPPWASGWRCAHLPVPSPHSGKIGSSAWAVAHDHALPRFFSPQRCMRSWWSGWHLFLDGSRSSASSILTTLDGRAARGYAEIHQVESAVAVHLCLQNAAT